jgi:hypothetical protein
MRPCQAHIANPALSWTAKGACRALRMHCIRGGDVASIKQVGRWTPTMQPIVTSHQKQPRQIHFPEQPRQRLSNTINSTIFFTSFLTKALRRSSAAATFPTPVSGHGKWVDPRGIYCGPCLFFLHQAPFLATEEAQPALFSGRKVHVRAIVGLQIGVIVSTFVSS